MKLFLIRFADWFDAIILQHRFYWICDHLANSSWWGDETEGWVKRSQIEDDLKAMASDPDIQREMKEISEEFRATDADGLDDLP